MAEPRQLTVAMSMGSSGQRIILRDAKTHERVHEFSYITIIGLPAIIEALRTAKDYIEREGTGVVEEAGVLGAIDGALDIAEGRDG